MQRSERKTLDELGNDILENEVSSDPKETGALGEVSEKRKEKRHCTQNTEKES